MQNNDAFILFFSLLAVLCQVFIAGTVVTAIASRRTFRSWSAQLQPLAGPFWFFVALVTVLGSLFMSDVKHFLPCHLCLIQRTLLYPQVLWSLLLWVKPDWIWIRRISFLMLFACIGVSSFHYILEYYPTLETSVCALTNPCSLVWFREFGYMTIAFMALTSAVTQLVLSAISYPSILKPKTFVLGAGVLTVVVFLYFILN